MTKEEAIRVLNFIEGLEGISFFYTPSESTKPADMPCLKEACRMAVAALQARQAPAKLDRSKWEGCWTCKAEKIRRLSLRHGREYCPGCGKPLTEGAWAELELRIGGKMT